MFKQIRYASRSEDKNQIIYKRGLVNEASDVD